MSPSSFKITLDDPPPPPPAPPKPANPAALTREERSNAGWHLRFIGLVIGLPSVLSVAFVGGVGFGTPGQPRRTRRPGWRCQPGS